LTWPCHCIIFFSIMSTMSGFPFTKLFKKQNLRVTFKTEHKSVPFQRKIPLWTPHNEEITQWITHFTTTNTASILPVLTVHVYFNYCLYKSIPVIETWLKKRYNWDPNSDMEICMYTPLYSTQLVVTDDDLLLGQNMLRSERNFKWVMKCLKRESTEVKFFISFLFLFHCFICLSFCFVCSVNFIVSPYVLYCSLPFMYKCNSQFHRVETQYQ
jgi:hypothetical protein